MIAFLAGLTIGWFLGIASLCVVVIWTYRKGVTGV